MPTTEHAGRAALFAAALAAVLAFWHSVWLCAFLRCNMFYALCFSFFFSLFSFPFLVHRRAVSQPVSPPLFVVCASEYVCVHVCVRVVCVCCVCVGVFRSLLVKHARTRSRARAHFVVP